MLPNVRSYAHYGEAHADLNVQSSSPYRFAHGRHRQRSPGNSVKEIRPQDGPSPPSQGQGLVTPGQDVDQPTRVTQSAPAQFVQTPRFSAKRISKQTAVQARAGRSSSPQKNTLAQALRSTLRHSEQVEEASPPTVEAADKLLLDAQPEAVVAGEGAVVPRLADLSHASHSPKRRRVDDVTADSTEIDLRQPSRLAHVTDTYAGNAGKAVPRFTRGAPSQTSIQYDAAHARHPLFLRPPSNATGPSEPLPDAFSPHRRGNEFVPGGMAASLQQYIIETGQAATQKRRAQGGASDGERMVKLLVLSISGDNPVAVRGTSQSGEHVGLLLAANQSAARPRRGAMITVREPTWEVELHGERWLVGVDWRALS